MVDIYEDKKTPSNDIKPLSEVFILENILLK